MSVVEVHRESAIGWITFNRPEVLNAINEEVLDAFATHIDRFANDKAIRVIAITGTGRAFSTGADISSLAKANAGARRKFMEQAHAMMTLIESAPKPVIAAVNGIAAGGGFELALACDFVFAERRAQFGLTEIRYGFLPGGGGTQRLLRHVSWSNAMYLLCSGDIISAQRAAELGIVFKIAEDEKIHAAVTAFAGAFVERSAEAIAAAKSLMRHAIHEPLTIGLQAEIAANLVLLRSEAVATAMAGFLSRRSGGVKEKGQTNETT